MPNPEQSLIPETSLLRLTSQKSDHRLTSQESDAVLRDRAAGLCRVVQRNISLFAGLLQVSTDDMPRAGQEHGNNATSREYRVGTNHGAHLHFFVPADRDNLKGTADWLLGADLVKLQVNTYNEELPVNMDKAPDFADSEAVIEISPAPEYADETVVLPSVMHAATYENGPRLDATNTETVIGVLTLIADQRQAELG